MMKGARMLSPTSYHLAVALLALTNAAGDSARKRLNLLEEVFGDVEAKFRAKERSPENLSEIREDMQLLRDSYEPIIDLDPWAYQKLNAFEGMLTETRTEIVTLIEQHNLTERDDISEVMLSPVLRRAGQ
ncbi:MAG: hypothetical protein WCQ97_10145 [Aminobacterium sp.]